MSPEEIEKMRLKIGKNPDSRLFLPLAEEYRRSGMLDSAIDVLKLGLQRHAHYTSAIVALGRIYLEKNMVDEARSRFEEVISAVPDNLFAHRKLAEIYTLLGENEKALSEYKEVLRLHPHDENAGAFLSKMDDRQQQACANEVPADEALSETASTEQQEPAQDTEDRPSVPESEIDISTADSLAAGGDYCRAAEIYITLLSRAPDNRRLKQRLAELKAFLKLSGRKAEALLVSLKILLWGIRKEALKRQMIPQSEQRRQII